MRLFAATIAAMALATPVMAATLPPDLAKAVRDYDQAQVKADRAELERLLADDYTLVGSSGRAETKSEFIADQLTPGERLDPFVVEQPVEKVWQDGAVMAGVVHATGLSGGKPFKVTLRFSDIWARRGGVWQVIYTHANRVAD